jgi:hypothetical protein
MESDVLKHMAKLRALASILVSDHEKRSLEMKTSHGAS